MWAAMFNIHTIIHTAGNKAASHPAPNREKIYVLLSSPLVIVVVVVMVAVF